MSDTKLPSHFCRIPEPNSPHYSDRVACNKCGESFVTMCDFKRAAIAIRKAALEEAIAVVQKHRDTFVADTREVSRYCEDDNSWDEPDSVRVPIEEMDEIIEAIRSIAEATNGREPA